MTVSVLSFFQVSPSLSYCAIFFISLTSLLLSVSLQTVFLPYFPLLSSLPPPPFPLFSSYLSIFCKLAALVRHRVSLFGKESAWWRYALSPSPSLCICFLSYFFLFLLIFYASSSSLPSHLHTNQHCITDSHLVYPPMFSFPPPSLPDLLV